MNFEWLDPFELPRGNRYHKYFHEEHENQFYLELRQSHDLQDFLIETWEFRVAAPHIGSVVKFLKFMIHIFLSGILVRGANSEIKLHIKGHLVQFVGWISCWRKGDIFLFIDGDVL